MTHNSSLAADHPSRLAALIEQIPPGRRGAALQCAVSFRPNATLERSFAVGPLRAAFADFWEARFPEAVPIRKLRAVLDPPVPISTVLEFTKLTVAGDSSQIENTLSQLTEHLHERITEQFAPSQLSLFEASEQKAQGDEQALPTGDSVERLSELVAKGCTFPTVYADPPWRYSNEASRAAAANHYPTMTLDEICAEPVRELAADNAHLHLWTTNAFLREAFDVIDAWGFDFKSCLVWVKDEIGMGNYWRVSHEFLLLGVRGSLTFRDRTLPSWVKAHRTLHSRKPTVVRQFIERVSPGPYLEVYGREALPDSAWTVYGNQIERRLF